MKGIITIIVLLISVTCFAQVTPQYYIERHKPGFAPPEINQIVNPPHVQDQSLLLADSFNTGRPPYGKIKNIYLRTGTVNQTHLWKGCKCTKALISLANTALNNFDTVTFG